MSITPSELISTSGVIRSRVEEVAAANGFRIQAGRWKGLINIESLSKKSGISSSTLYYLLRRPGQFHAISLVTLSKLCHAFGCDVGDLLVHEYVTRRNTLSYGNEKFGPRGWD